MLNEYNIGFMTIQVNLDMADSMGPGKLVRHMQSPSYTYDEYLICIGLGQSISSVISKFTCIPTHCTCHDPVSSELGHGREQNDLLAGRYTYWHHIWSYIHTVSHMEIFWYQSNIMKNICMYGVVWILHSLFMYFSIITIFGKLG